MGSENSINILSNSYYHSSTDKSVFDCKKDSKFLEYRKKWEEYPEKFITSSFPIHLDIETSAVCNLKCPFCASSSNTWGSEKRGLMDFDLFKKIIDEGSGNGLCSIKLSQRGEPLLQPKLAEMVRYAKDKGIMDVYFNTNATLLDKEKIETLLSSGLDRISISFEGYTKEVYEKYRRGACYEKTLANIKLLKEIRDAECKLFPQIRVQTVLLDELKPTYSEYVTFWKDIADEVAYIDARSEMPGTIHSGKTALWACPFLWQRMTILWDGKIIPCMMFGNKNLEKFKLGNVINDSISEVWNSPEMNAYRHFHKTGNAHHISFCDNCPHRSLEIEKMSKK